MCLSFPRSKQAVEKRRSEVKKLQKKTQKNHSEKYLEKEQKSLDDLHQLSKQLLSFRSQSLREVGILLLYISRVKAGFRVEFTTTLV